MASSGDILSSVTRIDNKFLLSDDRFWHLRDDGPCIAEIMSWAADRKTTRIEDTSYCLLRLFDINMPLLYGEGRKAFFRLQEELIKCSNDPSLFAWGLGADIQSFDFDLVMGIYISKVWKANTGQANTTGLLARSPENFRHSGSIRRRNLGMAGSGILRTPAIVNRGIRTEMCCFTLQELVTNKYRLEGSDEYFCPIWSSEYDPIFGMISCTIEDDDTYRLLIPLFTLGTFTSERRAGYEMFGRYQALPLILIHRKVLENLNLSSRKVLHVDSHWISDWCESSSKS
jgi:hypothetical protein